MPIREGSKPNHVAGKRLTAYGFYAVKPTRRWLLLCLGVLADVVAIDDNLDVSFKVGSVGYPDVSTTANGPAFV